MAYNFNTFGNVVTEAYNELSVDSSTVTVPGLELTQMEKWANRFAKLFIEKCKLKTQEDSYTFRTLTDDSLAADVASGAVSLTLSTSNATLGWPTSGIVLLDGTPYTYSNIVTTTMTVEAVDRAFSAGDTIRVGYVAPMNFGKPRDLFIDGTRYSLQKWGINDIVLTQQFSVFNDYIFLPEGNTSARDVTLQFYKKASNTLTTASTMEIYQMWDSYVIFMLTARGHRLLYDSNKAAEYDALAKEVLKQAKQQVAEEDLSVDRAFSPGW